MKKISILVCVLFIVEIGFAQNRQIQFEENGFTSALAKAKALDKLLFLDAYTSWCGPCKIMAQEVFTQDSVADFFNTHLVCLKMDMEKGEGKELKVKYQVEVYPTFLLLNGEGQEIFRLVGKHNAEQFLKQIKQGIDPDRSPLILEKRYVDGERKADFIQRYCAYLAGTHQSNKLKQVVEDFFKGKKVKEICLPENWAIYDQYVTDINSSLFHRMIDQGKLFKKWKGREIIEAKLSQAYTNVIFSSIPNTPLSEEICEQYAKDIRKMDIQNRESLFYLNSYLYLAKLRAQKKYDEFLDFCEAGPENYSPERKSTLIMCLVFLADGTKEQRQRGIKLLFREAKAEKQRSGALPSNMEQVLGYTLYKLKGEDIK